MQPAGTPSELGPLCAHFVLPIMRALPHRALQATWLLPARTTVQDHGVVEWVAHGLNLPQYAHAFKQNAITALDFPFLLSDGGAALAADLGVSSKLHQQQVGGSLGEGCSRPAGGRPAVVRSTTMICCAFSACPASLAHP